MTAIALTWATCACAPLEDHPLDPPSDMGLPPLREAEPPLLGPALDRQREAMRVVFLGDSITQDGHFVSAVEDALLARAPGIDWSIHNAGTSGDRLGWRVTDRLAADVLTPAPDLVVVMFGMNDGLYAPLDAARLDAWQDDLTALVDALAPATVVLTSPSYPDPLGPIVSGHGGDPILPEYPDVMRAYGLAAREVADETGAHLSDVWHAMATLTREARHDDPTFTLVPDGIHPDAGGGLVIAHTLLDTLDGGHPDPVITLDCQEDGAAGEASVLTHPFRPGVPPIVRAAFIARHTRATLRVDCLAPGTYTLSANGEPLGELTADALVRGVDLTAWVESPWGHRATRWLTVSEARRTLYADVIRPAMVEAKRAAAAEDDAAVRAQIFADAHAATAADRATAARLADEAADHARPVAVTLRLTPVE